MCGAAILTLGVWLHFDSDVVTMLKIMEETPSETHVTSMAAFLTMGLGAFVLLVGFLGCCGACCESMCMLCLVSQFKAIFWNLIKIYSSNGTCSNLWQCLSVGSSSIFLYRCAISGFQIHHNFLESESESSLQKALNLDSNPNRFWIHTSLVGTKIKTFQNRF